VTTGAHPPSTGGRLVYAIGDVHGYPGVLRSLVDEIARDVSRTRPAERPLLIFIGDYVDRGPDSRAVIEAVIALQADPRFEVVALKGNHEDALLRVLDDRAFGPSWCANWGQATLRSYGVEPPASEVDAEDARQALARAFPSAHRRFLEDLPVSLTVGDYLFVHAGVRPGVPLAEQAERDLIWIRYDFLESDEAFGKVVVHGHTPAEAPELRANRIGIDTGVYMTGVLTAVRLRGEEQRFIQARG